MKLNIVWLIILYANRQYQSKFHLSNGMRLNFENYILLEDLFCGLGQKNGAELHKT
jgi:hypothetical protein